MQTVMESLDLLNSFRQGELAAVETYQQALDQFGKPPLAADLRSLQAHHREAAELLRLHIVEQGGVPAESSGAWGMWAQAVDGAAALFGVSAALKALKIGEEQGSGDFERALEDPELDPACQRVIHALLPLTRAHVALLDELIAVKQ